MYNRYYRVNIPLEYWDLNFGKSIEAAQEKFPGQESILKVHFDYTSNLKQAYFVGKSFCLVGPHGTGKTTCATNILKTCALQGLGALYTTLSDAVALLTSAPNDERFLVRRELLETDFLVCDEFDGRFFSSENASDLFGRTLESIIRTRLSNKLPTILISNSPNPKEIFSGPLKASIESLMNKIQIIPIIGKDYRKNFNPVASAIEEKAK